jgi:hypothetical protein
MKTTYTIVPEEALVIVTYPENHPTHQRWTSLMRNIFADPAFQPGFNFLFDKREVQDAASTDSVEAKASFYRSHRGQFGRCAIVTHGLLAFGMGRMAEGYCGAGVRTFADIDVARQWLRTGAAPVQVQEAPAEQTQADHSTAA